MLLLILAASVLTGACGGAGDGAAAGAPVATPPPIGTDERSVEAAEEYVQGLARRKEAARRAGDLERAERLERAMQAVEQAQEEAFDAETDEDRPFDEAVDRLPLREAPLHIEQFVLEDGSHELVVRTSRFFCIRGAERLAAVRTYHDRARAIMRTHGIDDFALVVDEARETGEVKPLARARGRVVRLTARGRGAGRCTRPGRG